MAKTTASASAAAATATNSTSNGSTMNSGSVPDFILPPVVKRILKQLQQHKKTDDPTTPPQSYTTDFEYLEAVSAVESLRLLEFHLKHGLTNSFFSVDLDRKSGGSGQRQQRQQQQQQEEEKKQQQLPSTAESRGPAKTGEEGGGGEEEEEDESPILNVKETIDWLRELTKSLEEFRLGQLSRMTKKPVLEAFLEAMEATENQCRIFRFVVAIKSGLTGYAKMYGMGSSAAMLPMDLAPIYENQVGLAQMNTNGINSKLLSDLFQIPLLELFSLANPKSKWVKEQIYQDCKSSVNHSIVRGETWTTKSLMGVELDLTTFEGINSQVLQKCLLEDKFFQQTSTGKAALKMKEMENGIIEDGGESNSSSNDKNSKRKEPPMDDFMMQFQAAQQAFGGPLKGNVLEILSMARGKQQKMMGLDQENDDDNKSDEKKMEAVSMPFPGDDLRGSAMSMPFPLEMMKGKGGVADLRGTATTNEGETHEEDNSSDSLVKEEFGPYKSDLSYLEDQVRIMEQARLLTRMKSSLQEDKFKEDKVMFRDQQEHAMVEGYFGHRGRNHNAKMTEGQREEKKQNIERLTMFMKKMEDRVATRLKVSRKEMRLEQLCKALELTKFEKFVILSLLKSMIMPPTGQPDPYDYDRYAESGFLRASVGQLIKCFCISLEEKMNHRSYFYRSSTLIREGIVRLVQSDFAQDLTLCQVDLDRRMFDFIVGLDTEFSEVVDGSHLYLPTVELEDVVLPEETKQRVIDVVLNFENTKKKIRELEVQDKITYGLGQVLLFHGRSGTGKTMLANAIAAKAKKKVLLINFPALPPNGSGAIIKMLFREANVNGAILFFDECEQLFYTRKKGGTSVTMVLTELEKFDGLCILATNRAMELDEAIHRRISLAVEFRKPDLIQREAIWKKLHPPKVPIEDHIDYGFLARKFELSGGQIKNCWVSSLGMMVQRGVSAITQDYLEQAAKEQIHGQLSMEAFDRSVVPTHGLDSLVVSEAVREALNGIVQAKKAQSVLSNWGFDKLHRSNVGVSALFAGPPGTGKTMAAEAIGYEIGKPLLVVNVAELVSKWVGETGKNIEGIFNDAKSKEAVLVFDEAEGLFGSRTKGGDSSVGRHDNMNVGLLLHYIENFPGICIVITNHKDAIDDAFLRRWRHVVAFTAPGVSERERIWKQMIPKACPLDAGVSFANLASRFELKGGEIRQALMRAASKAALRSDEKKRVIKMEDLETACRQELEKKDQQRLAASMYS